MIINVRRAGICASASAIPICAYLVVIGCPAWAAGLGASAAWAFINFALTIRLLEAAALKAPRANIASILMVKFPVLYLAGLLALVRGWFPPLSLLAGMTLTMLSIGTVYLWPKRT